MKPRSIAVLLAAVTLAAGASPASAQAERWWADVSVLAHDSMMGRASGTEQHRKAARFVASRFAEAGLRPGGENGFEQKVTFLALRPDGARSRLAVVSEGAEDVLSESDAYFLPASERTLTLNAPLVFVGYGIHAPSAGHDDLAGMDLRGKVAVYIPGVPTGLPPVLMAHARSTRVEMLHRAGAVAVLPIQPAQPDSIWRAAVTAAARPRLVLADSAASGATIPLRPTAAARLLRGSGHELDALVALAARGAPLPRFALRGTLRGTLAASAERTESPNVVGILEGSDASLRGEYLVLTAHLDHVGVGVPVAGDSIYNGAMDNASGVATLIETARTIRERGLRPRRSIVFLAVTGEESGLLGSLHYARHPTVPKGSIVANLNTDMFLPLYPLKGIIGLGADESDLGADLATVTGGLGLEVMPDPEPEEVRFVRSDQYSFIKEGVPALALKAGYRAGTPEMETQVRWRAQRYHKPSDDLTQPVDLRAASDFNEMYLRLVTRIADRPTRPAWLPASPFSRGAR